MKSTSNRVLSKRAAIVCVLASIGAIAAMNVSYLFPLLIGIAVGSFVIALGAMYVSKKESK